jgi:EmrB/QacA subfamily drug resistance transporter
MDPPVATLKTVTSPGGRTVSRNFIFAIVATIMMMGAIDQTIVATALPTLQRSLHAPITWSSWTITIYQLGQVVAMPVIGRVSDQFGRKRVFLIAIIVFIVASLCCGLSTNIYELVLFRALQALGGGAFMPSATGIVADTFGKDRDRAIGMFTSIVPIGSMAGPVLGGFLIAIWSWRAVFYINLPIGIVTFVLAVIYLPRSREVKSGRADVLGMLLLVMMMLPLMYGITTLGDGHTSLISPSFLIPEIFAAAFVYLFVRHAGRAEVPIISLRLLKIRAFATMNLVAGLYGGCALGIGTLVPLYGEERYGLSSIQVGSLLTARAVGVISLAGITAFAMRRIGYRIPMMLGFALSSIGMLLVALHPPFFGTYGWLALGSTIMGLGIGTAAPATNNAILSYAPREIASTAALRGTFRQVGGIIAISITTAIVSRSSHPGLALSHCFVGYAVLIVVLVLPLVMSVPDQRGGW